MVVKIGFHGIAVPLVSLLFVAGCGGGSGSEPLEQVTDANGGVQGSLENTSARGTIVLEERRGKLVIDAWFAAATANTAELDNHGLWPVTDPLDNDVCSVKEHSIPIGPADLAAASSDREHSQNEQAGLDVGDVLLLTSRSGVVGRLNAQRFNSRTQYATEERWFDDPLPDDAMLDLSGEGALSAVSGIPLTQLTPLSVMFPLNGFLSNANENVRWEASAQSDDVIRLWLDVLDSRRPDQDASPRQESMSVRCVLQDDGEFSIPDSIRTRLPGNHGGFVVSLRRERVEEHEYGNATIAVVQMSYP